MRRVTFVLAALALVPIAGLPHAASAQAAARPAQAAPAARKTLDDPTIVAIFDAANSADVETGALAEKRGRSKEVREFGAMLARDHAHVRQLGRDLAKKLGVTPTPPRPDAGARDHAAAMKRLSSIPASQFDHAFLQHEVAFHKAVIDAVTTTLLPAIQNAEVKELVVKVAPAFQAHMAEAQRLDDALTKAKR